MTKPQQRARRYVETSEYLKALARLIRGAGRRVGQADSDDLADLFQLQRELEMTILQAIANLRAAGATWQEIGDASGTTGQAATMRWKARIEELEQRAPRQAAS